MPYSSQRLELLAEIAGRLLLSGNPQGLVEELCTKVMTFLDCQAFFNFLTDEDKGQLHLNACAGIPKQAAAEIEWLDIGTAVCGCVARQGQRIVAEHIQTTPPDPRTLLVKSYGIQAYACHPLLTTGGRVIGTLSFGSRTKTTFSDDDLSLMKAVTDQVAIAMERIRALEAERSQRHLMEELAANLEQRVADRTLQVQQLANRLRALTVELAKAEQLERRRVTTILHEHVQQVLVASRMQLSLAQRMAGGDGLCSILEQVDRYLEEALAASRSLAVELSPPVLHDVGLTAGLNWLVNQMQNRYSLRVDLVVDQGAEPESETARLFLFHAVRELLFNVVKHAGTNSADVSMRRDAGFIELEIRDQGKGFDASLIDARQTSDAHFGLFSIRERLKYLGGAMGVDSDGSRGTRISLKVPISLEEETDRKVQDTQLILPTLPGRHQRPDSGTKIRVVLADDHKIVRQGLMSVLMFEPDIEVVGEAADGKQALDLARELRPDVIVMDVSMPVMDGIESTTLIRQCVPDTSVIGLSMHESDDVASAMKRAGARAYLTKGGPSEELTGAIRSCSISQTGGRTLSLA